MNWQLERIEDEMDRDLDTGESEFDRENELIPLIKRATYSFDGRASSTQTLVLADGVDATRMRVGGLVMLVHQRANFSATADLWSTTLALARTTPTLLMWIARVRSVPPR